MYRFRFVKFSIKKASIPKRVRKLTDFCKKLVARLNSWKKDLFKPPDNVSNPCRFLEIETCRGFLHLALQVFQL